MAAKVKSKKPKSGGTKSGGSGAAGGAGGAAKGQRKNPKAFSVANVVRTKRTMQRNLDRGQKKEIIPLTNRAEDAPPPALVVVMGPKMYSGQNLTDTVGPITVVAGK
ncbi:hypothetical protein B484DRAFT_392116, partial [Ochromonadaceae sp. CCMP2298]